MSKPNILIFMTDQQQAQVTYPDHPCRTPNLDQLAAEGVRFNESYTTMAHCCPSRASFMTGLYPSQHGIYNNVSNETAIHKTLNEGVTTFAEQLKSAGYSMHFSGKWHISAEENPADRGWEELEVSADKNAYMGKKIHEWRETDKKENTGDKRKNGEIARRGWGDFQLYGSSSTPLEETHDNLVVQKAIDRLQQLKNQSDPWCMYVGTFGPHDPFVIPEKYAKMYNPEDVELPLNYGDTFKNKPGVYKRMRQVWDQLTEQEVKESIAHYWGYCTMMDDLFGQVLDALKSTGQMDDTLILFISDHGESLGAHGLYLKGISPYDETYRVPCIIRWPEGVRQPGREVDKLISMIDFAPTFLELANVQKPEESKGRSLLPWLRNEVPQNWRDAVFSQCNGVEVYYTQRIVRTERYKLVYNPTDVDELYDLQEDPFELKNVADRTDMKTIKESLFIKMWKEAADVDDIIFNSYPTVATADIGPAEAIGKDQGRSD
ncbi:sulfatase-like hydrolase/transferase [Lentibacillus sediminis]|uniref:sulfatase-like hydrolase/transferase n=1 Tax=Lentibacillus sediminis TaxID=1940529 RepID=UPI0013043AA4|nr:sulfatase-like hydrolase/transferase [Lentibacillus sediminis]